MAQKRIWITPEEASFILGMGHDRIRNLMKLGKLPIGSVVPSSTGKQFRFRIYIPMLMEYLHITEWPESWPGTWPVDGN